MLISYQIKKNRFYRKEGTFIYVYEANKHSGSYSFP
jgi:hypothetical protein